MDRNNNQPRWGGADYRLSMCSTQVFSSSIFSSVNEHASYWRLRDCVPLKIIFIHCVQIKLCMQQNNNQPDEVQDKFLHCWPWKEASRCVACPTERQKYIGNEHRRVVACVQIKRKQPNNNQPRWGARQLLLSMTLKHMFIMPSFYIDSSICWLLNLLMVASTTKRRVALKLLTNKWVDMSRSMAMAIYRQSMVGCCFLVYNLIVV